MTLRLDKSGIKTKLNHETVSPESVIHFTITISKEKKLVKNYIQDLLEIA